MQKTFIKKYKTTIAADNINFELELREISVLLGQTVPENLLPSNPYQAFSTLTHWHGKPIKQNG